MSLAKYQNILILLKQYRINKSDYEMALSELSKLQKQLERAETGTIENKDEVIEGLCLDATALSDTPHSNTNMISSSTENTALNYLNYLQPSPLEIKALKRLIQEKEHAIEELFNQFNTVDNMLISLTDRERFVIENIYIRGFSHIQTIFMHNKAFEHCAVDTRDTIVKIKLNALEKMSNRIK